MGLFHSCATALFHPFPLFMTFMLLFVLVKGEEAAGQALQGGCGKRMAGC